MRLLSGFAPAGGNDIIARLMGRWLTERLDQTFVIENRPGAGTNIAAVIAHAKAQSWPDQHGPAGVGSAGPSRGASCSR